jgi:hypothetical protein
MEKASSECVDFQAAVCVLANSPIVQSLVRNTVGLDKLNAALTLMKSGQLDGELGSIVHDLLIDAIDNESEQVWSGIIRTPHDDYPVNVNYFHGVYWVWAMEYDPVGYFLDEGAAVDFASSEWGDVIPNSEEVDDST